MSWVNPKIEIRETDNKGKGMFARESMGINETVLVWGGEYTDTAGAERARKEGRLVLQWDIDLYSVENRGDDLGYFINHSCDGNTWMTDAYTLVARRPINVLEEVTADYALWEADPAYTSEWMCRCGSPVCRKHITGSDWMLPEVHDRYRGHFSPLINTLIMKKYGYDR